MWISGKLLQYVMISVTCEMPADWLLMFKWKSVWFCYHSFWKLAIEFPRYTYSYDFWIQVFSITQENAFGAGCCFLSIVGMKAYEQIIIFQLFVTKYSVSWTRAINSWTYRKGTSVKRKFNSLSLSALS